MRVYPLILWQRAVRLERTSGARAWHIPDLEHSLPEGHPPVPVRQARSLSPLPCVLITQLCDDWPKRVDLHPDRCWSGLPFPRRAE